MRRSSSRVVPDIRDALLDAAEQLLARYGYKKTTMDDVARLTGVGKGTIYLHFPSKEELILGTIDRLVDRLLDKLRSIAGSSADHAERLREMTVCRVLFRFDSVRDYSESLDDLLRALRPEYLVRRQGYFAAEAEVFAAVLREGHDAGTFHCQEPAAAAQAIILATNSLLPYSLSSQELGRRKDVKEKAEQIADLLLSGLLRRTGR
jgi:AcrR family transcriptional regulator